MKTWLSLTELSTESGIARDILREWIVTGKLNYPARPEKVVFW